MAQPDEFLSVNDVEAVYDQAILALRGVSLEVAKGSIVALLGGNGAGKTTALKAISNLLGAERGKIRRGSIRWKGLSVDRLDPADLVRGGLVQVLEGRHCFPHLTVEENLLTGAMHRRLPHRVEKEELDRIYNWFPRLKDRRRSKAGLTSGGEQQMTAIGRALMTGPELMLLDEPSMGLAPRAVGEIFEIIRRLHDESGVSFLISEQNATLVLEIADYGYVLENGNVALSGTADELSAGGAVQELYLGASALSRRNGDASEVFATSTNEKALAKFRAEGIGVHS
jgi:branched-chain amino acid transport system ATP-binding protein